MLAREDVKTLEEMEVSLTGSENSIDTNVFDIF